MTKCYKMARELGKEILNSEEYARLKAANAVFDKSGGAPRKPEAYKLKQGRESMENGEVEDMAADLQNDPVIGEYISAQNDFSDLVNTVMDILRATITGEMPQGCGDCCEKCHGCGE